MKSIKKYKNRKDEVNVKKKNAKLFPIYKMFSWDLLFYYSIQYLFFTKTKAILPGDLLKANAFYPIFIIIMQLPAAISADLLGRKKSLIIGNFIMCLYIFVLITFPGLKSVFIGNIIFAFGYSIKSMQETNILYDSVATRGGEGLYPKINALGAKGYYMLDGIASLLAGYLFVINGYLPMYICMIFTIISTIMSFGFQDIYVNKLEQNEVVHKIKEYKEDFKYSVKNILKSKRLKSLLIFIALFNALITISFTYQGNILTELGIKPENFSIINSILTIIAGLSVVLQDKLHKKFRNKTLMVLSMLYTMSIVFIGMLLFVETQNVLFIILVLFLVRSIVMPNYFVLTERYLKNFSTPKSRTRISFTAEFFTNIIEAIFLFAAGVLLNATNIKFATLSAGLVFLILFVIVLKYMKTRVGLKPEMYTLQDIQFD